MWDFKDTPNIQRWMDDISSNVPYHDEIHTANEIMGDLSDLKPAKMDTLIHANKSWLKKVNAILETL